MNGTGLTMMDGLPLTAKILKSLVAPARHSDGPTLYLICSEDDQHVIYEQMLGGTCQAWPDGVQGVQQAEGMIYQQAQGNADSNRHTSATS